MPAHNRSLRDGLRSSTAKAHDRLDATMREASGWSAQQDYASFLGIQFSARVPVEKWLERHALPRLLPPAQAPLLAQDLTAMGYALPYPAGDFAFEPESAFSVLGAAWVLAGSALGNRAILKEVLRASAGGPDWPHAFLGDPAMFAFWQTLRNQLDNTASEIEAAHATASANAVFDHVFTTAQGYAGVSTPAKAHAA